MQEIRVMIDLTNVNRNKKFKKLYYHVTSRLLFVKVMTIGFFIDFICAYALIIFIWKRRGVILYREAVFFILLVIVYFILYWLRFKRHIDMTCKTYGKRYEMIINSKGIQINNQYIPLKKGSKVVEYPQGIAIVNSFTIFGLLQKEAFSEEEYEIVRKYVKNYPMKVKSSC